MTCHDSDWFYLLWLSMVIGDDPEKMKTKYYHRVQTIVNCQVICQVTETITETEMSKVWRCYFIHSVILF